MFLARKVSKKASKKTYMEGCTEKMLKIVRKMKNTGLLFSEIAEITGLPLETIG